VKQRRAKRVEVNIKGHEGKLHRSSVTKEEGLEGPRSTQQDVSNELGARQPVRLGPCAPFFKTINLPYPSMQRKLRLGSGRGEASDSSITRCQIAPLSLGDRQKSAKMIRQSTGVLPASTPEQTNLFVIDGQASGCRDYQAFKLNCAEGRLGATSTSGRLCFRCPSQVRKRSVQT